MTKKHLEVVQGAGDREPSFTISTGALGMWVFLISLTVLFIASIIAYLVVRSGAQEWKTATMPDLPSGLWGSTVIILFASITIQLALTAARKNQLVRLKHMLLATFILGLAFLVGQVLNWRELVNANLPPTAKTLYAFTFYMLTSLHAIHVVGGLIPLGVVTRRAYLERYSSVYHRGVTYQVMYWHFLDAVWVVLFGTMLIAT